MKIKVSDLQKLARESARRHKEALNLVTETEGGVSCSMSYDVGYHQGRLHAFGEIYNLIRRIKK